MKVLFANKFFYPRGGAENSFFETARLLKNKGHGMIFFSMQDPRNLPTQFSEYFVTNVDLNAKGSLFEQARTAARIHYSFEARRKIARLIESERPQIAHLNNISHQISPSIIDALKQMGVPIVMSLRDYKLTCPVYTLLNKGRICEECSKGRFYKVFVNRCTKGSSLKSAVSMTEMYLHHALLHIYEKVDVFISPSRFLLEKTQEMGFRGKILHLPNFIVPEDYMPAYGQRENSIVYVGRLSEEKGVSTLMDAMKGLGLRLKIIGEGPLGNLLKEKAKTEGIANVDFLGFRSGSDLKDEIRKSMFAVIPSEWYENNPRSVLEAFALGKPVIGSRIGGIPELVKDNETGFLFEHGNTADLREKIAGLAANEAEIVRLGKNARAFAEKEFNQERHYEGLMSIYSEASGCKW